jgi:uncharacterized membrane protein YkvA (DUF1232 family)
MIDLESRCLQSFPQWLASLAGDAQTLSRLLADPALPEVFRQQLAGGLNYLLESVDLIQDGIEELGYVDDAFVLRVAAAELAQCSEASRPSEEAHRALLARLAHDTGLVREFLGDDFERLRTHVRSLIDLRVREREPEQLVGDPAVRGEFLAELLGWAESYTPPAWKRDPKNLIKLKSFLHHRWPAMPSAPEWAGS